MEVERTQGLPHIVLDWNGDLGELSNSFRPFLEDNNNWRIVIEELYLELQKRRAIIPVTVVEEGHVQNFYTVLSKSDKLNTLTVRLDHNTDPVKTRGVKRSLALLAEQIVGWDSSIRLNKHNLENYLHL
jgi:hypothetical protein